MLLNQGEFVAKLRSELIPRATTIIGDHPGEPMRTLYQAQTRANDARMLARHQAKINYR